MNEEKFGLSDENRFHWLIMIISLFLFVKFVLDMLGRVSQVFQQRYLMIWEV